MNSNAWNKLGAKGSNLPEKVRIQYASSTSTPSMLKRATKIFGRLRTEKVRRGSPNLAGIRKKSEKIRKDLVGSVSSVHEKEIFLKRVLTDEGFDTSKNTMMGVLTNSLLLVKLKRNATYSLFLSHWAANLMTGLKDLTERSVSVITILNLLRNSALWTVHDPWVPILACLEGYSESIQTIWVLFPNSTITNPSECVRLSTSKKAEASNQDIKTNPVTKIADIVPAPMKETPSFCIGGEEETLSFSAFSGMKEKVDRIGEATAIRSDSEIMKLLEIEMNINKDSSTEGNVNVDYHIEGGKYAQRPRGDQAVAEFEKMRQAQKAAFYNRAKGPFFN